MSEHKQEPIKNCPFCGGKAHLYNNFYYTLAYVKCSKCGIKTKEYKGRDWENINLLAIKAWNRRVNNG